MNTYDFAPWAVDGTYKLVSVTLDQSICSGKIRNILQRRLQHIFCEKGGYTFFNDSPQSARRHTQGTVSKFCHRQILRNCLLHVHDSNRYVLRRGQEWCLDRRILHLCTRTTPAMNKTPFNNIYDCRYHSVRRIKHKCVCKMAKAVAHHWSFSTVEV